jgi:D-alanyl-D-alanine carboxypeptidase (penicillin-binding protein 5/6)
MTRLHRLCAGLFFLLLAGQALAQLSVPPPVVAARSYVLLDVQSGQILAASNADAQVEPASLTKMMTAYLVFTALREKRVALDQMVTISKTAYDRARQDEQSRMFIDPKVPVSVGDMLKGMIIQSGNDASIALAEVVAGSEEQFVELMNKQAQKMGLKDTRYVNSTGMPAPSHVTTALDMVHLAQRLITDFPQEYASYYSQKSYAYNKITQENRNRLLWLDPTVDGVKTGHTASAGFCLVASSRRPGALGSTRRVISVVMGTAGPDVRVQESGKLLNWAFQSFDNVRISEAGKAIATPEIWKGKTTTAELGFVEDGWLSIPKGSADRIKTELTRPQPLVAPVARGQDIGTLKVLLDGKVVAERPVQVLKDVEQAGILGRAWDSMRLWFK